MDAQTIDDILQKVSKIDTVLEMQRRHEAVLERLSEAVSKLAVIEDRQNSDRDAVKRLFDHLSTVDERLAALERAEVLNERVRYVSFAFMGVALLAMLYAVLRLIGLPSG